MTTTKTISTASEAMQARDIKHLELITISRAIVSAQSEIESHQSEINKMNPSSTFYQPVSNYHIAAIETLTEKRNNLICKYEESMWVLYSASLPIFSTTSIQEVAKTLYTVQAAHA